MCILNSIWLYRLLRWGIGGSFIVAGCIKLLNPDQFAIVIDAFGLVPEYSIDTISILLPVFEVVAGMALIFDIAGGLFSIFVLLVIFMAILGYGIHLGLDIDCGCYGPGDPEAGAFSGMREALYRDVGMMAGILFIAVWRFRQSHRPVSVKYFLDLKRRKTCDSGNG